MKNILKECALSLFLHVINLLLILFYSLGHIVFFNLWIVFLYVLVTAASVAVLKDKETLKLADFLNLILCLCADGILVLYWWNAVSDALHH